ncbi:MAG TPA: DUF6364 family protein [Chryseolinea sp.]|nr:DUF6364 family protein [Chryseolinea sp.]
MDAKITLSFDEKIVQKAKKFADANNVSLSRLTEYLYRKITTENYKNLEDMPVADWINQLAEGEAAYKTKTRKRGAMKKEFFAAKR